MKMARELENSFNNSFDLDMLFDNIEVQRDKMMRNEYFFDEDNYFVIENYNNTKPFSSFLPGIAGTMGIPLWVFYVNRGQGIASFGIQDKNHPILEFFPANKSYQFTRIRGFRTFIKMKRDQRFFEPFSPRNPDTLQRMKIKTSHFEIEEISSPFGLHLNVKYFTIPQEDYAALIRHVSIRNITSKPLEFEILDGLPNIVPFGANEIGLKSMNYTLESWMRVENLENKVPFYKMAQLPGDRPIVDEISAGNFYLAFIQQNGKAKLLDPIVDPQIVFGRNTSLYHPDHFLIHNLDDIYKQKQINRNKSPCGFFGESILLDSEQKVEIISIIGHAISIAWLNDQINRISSISYIENKYLENKEIISSLTQNIKTNTSSKAFNNYCEQTFLDNLLRGGFPHIIDRNETESVVFHTFIRKHGDMERDYNYFLLEPNYFSQGNGNYRDVCQNRRCDVLFNPRVKYSNILTFMNLIQSDGYNPLEIRGSRFWVKEENLEKLNKFVCKPEKLRELVTHPFSPGKFIKSLKSSQMTLSIPLDDFLTKVLSLAEYSVETGDSDEGYWVDHWTYTLDLIENYFAIYPEKKDILLFDLPFFTFYDNSAVVVPRSEKYVLIGEKVRQIGAVIIDRDKEAMINSRSEFKNLVRENNGNGAIFRTTLFTKMLHLVLIKFSTLDPCGMGVEMEANKPGWYDALNGLPGIFGSSMSETYELSRSCTFLLEIISENEKRIIHIPIELSDLLISISTHLQTLIDSNTENKDFTYWDRVSAERENYRERIKFGFDGEIVDFSFSKLKQIIQKILQKINQGISRAIELSDNNIPTYFYFEVKDFELIYDEQGGILTTDNFPRVNITQFEPKTLPLFLEGYVKALKIQSDNKKARNLWKMVRKSKLYDKKLRMYKLNVSLENQPEDIGRAKAFTPGWLENESIWMHMDYKFLLELLRCELYEEFFLDFKNILIPFQDPAIYGRNPAENSSFIVSSAFPDEKIHGTGYYGRLSGATAEFLSIWTLLMIGKNPFLVENNQLCLKFKPVLPSWLFDDNNTITFNFLGSCKVIYHNPKNLDTYDEKVRIKEIQLEMEDGHTINIDGDTLGPPYASMVRSGKIRGLSIVFE
ncbi:MAG: cellobiose phosphorylase [Candidatus Heimdallarchaeota archaeon]|nr:MAG: cellobiose phosphorylase [Candidatus Heimdallarchaeota archaeon]